MPKSCGIEINKHKVKICVIDYAAKKPRILGYVEGAIPEEQERTWEERAFATLKTISGKLKIPRDAIAMSVDSSDVLIREITLPYKKDEQIKQVYKGQFANLVHDYDVDDLIVDYFKVGETEKETNLLTIGVPKEVLAANIQVLERAGLDPITIDVDVTALFNAIYNLGIVEPQETVLVIHGSLNRFAKFILIENDKIKAIRTIRFVVPNVSKQEVEEFVQSREWKTENVKGPIPVVVVAEEDAEAIDSMGGQMTLTRLLQKEVLRFITAYASDNVSYVLLTGDFEKDEIRAIVQPQIPIPVKTVNILEVIEHPFRDQQEEIATKVHVPLGLALKAGDVDVLRLEFRKEDFLYRKKYGKVKMALTVTFELLIVLVAVIGLYLYFNKYKLYESAANSIYEMERTECQKVEMEDVPNEQLYGKLQELFKSEELLRGGGDYPLKDSALQILGQIYTGLNEFYQQNNRSDDFYCEVEKIDIQQPMRIALDLKLKTPQQAKLLLETIKKQPLLAAADWDGNIGTVGEFRKCTIAINRERR